MPKEKLNREEFLAALAKKPAIAALNPQLFGSQQPPQTRPEERTGGDSGRSDGKKALRTSPKPKTAPERMMAALLERHRIAGEISRWQFEGLTLLIGDGTRYTPDFYVVDQFDHVKLIEMKGPFIREDSLIKAKVAKAHYPEFEFEMWQLKNGSLDRIL